MALKALTVALGAMVALSPVSATSPAPSPGPAASDSADTLYCLRIEAITGTRLERVRCWTRQEWADLEVDVDKEWAKEGVAVIRPASG